MANRKPALLTTNSDQFIESLRPGDVLLFDGVHFLSQLIKLGENRPVNHCGVYLGDAMFAEVGAHEYAEDRAAPLEVPAARAESLTDEIGGPPLTVRTVTALRHVNATSAGARAVVERANRYVESRDTTYRYLSLIALMVPSLFRTYEGYFTEGKKLASLATTLRVMSQAMLDAFETGSAKLPPDDLRKTLTCSEFVYRCFAESDPKFAVAVDRPLGKWVTSTNHLRRAAAGAGAGAAAKGARPAARSGAPRSAAGTRTRSDGRRPTPVSGDGLIQFDSSLMTNIAMLPGEVASGAGARSRGMTKDLAVLAGRTVLEVIRHNLEYDKYQSKSGTAAKRGEVVADLVTPRDLWSSSSLVPVSVLHRPPGSGDGDLDGIVVDDEDDEPTPPSTRGRPAKRRDDDGLYDYLNG